MPATTSSRRPTSSRRATSSGRSATALGLALALAPGLAGGAAAQEEGNVFTNLFRYGGTTVPPAAPETLDAPYCPMVDVAEGGAAVQAYSGPRTGDQAQLRNQVAIADLARECAPLADGSVSVRVGVQVRALLGPGGAPGRFEAPVRILIKRGEATVATRSRRLAVTVPSGSSQATAAFVEEAIAVPARYARDYEIEVSLGGAAPRERTPRRRARPEPGQG